MSSLYHGCVSEGFDTGLSASTQSVCDLTLIPFSLSSFAMALWTLLSQIRSIEMAVCFYEMFWCVQVRARR